MTVPTHHGLYPVPSELLDKIAPDFLPAVKYIIERNVNSKQDFENSTKLFSREKTNYVQKSHIVWQWGLFSQEATRQRPSFHIYHLRDNVFKTLEGEPIFQKGNYIGCQTRKPNTPNDNMSLRS